MIVAHLTPLNVFIDFQHIVHIYFNMMGFWGPGSTSCRKASAGKLFCVGEDSRGQDIVVGGRMGSSGSKGCRRASAGRRFCVGDGDGGRRRDIVPGGGRRSSGSKNCRRASAGRLFCVWGRGYGGWGGGRRLV